MHFNVRYIHFVIYMGNNGPGILDLHRFLFMVVPASVCDFFVGLGVVLDGRSEADM
jgi:hypothetical protein